MKYLILNQNILKRFAIISLFISMIAGRFSFDRFIIKSAHSEWLGVCYWFALLAAVACFLLWHFERKNEWKPTREAIFYLIMLFILYLYFVLNVLFIGNVNRVSYYSSDALIIMASAILIVALFNSEDDVAVFAQTAEAVGVILFFLALFGFGDPDINGHGWAPIGGPITFYRIEFLTFCSALYLFWRNNQQSSIVHLVVAALGLFSTLASLSKAAMLAVVVVIILYTFWLLSTKDYRKSIIVIVLAITVSLCFNYSKGSVMRSRVDEAFSALTWLKAILYDDLVIGTSIKIQSGEKITFKDLNHDQQERIMAFVTLISKSDEDKEKIKASLTENDLAQENLSSLLRYMSRFVMLSDRSNRIAMALHAWHLFDNNRYYGVGMGNYHFSTINAYTKKIEVYSYPHNIFLEIAATTGLIGLILFSGLLFASWILLQKSILRYKSVLFMLGYPVFVVITALYSGDIYDFRLFWYVALIVLISYKFKDPVMSNAELSDRNSTVSK